MSRRVLDVGQCGFDHGSISRLLSTRFGASVDRAHSLAEALQQVQGKQYDLVLVNRVLDADGTEGMAVLSAIKQDPATATVPVMLVSNYEDAQAQAIAAGAEPGFGKSSLNAPATVDRLGRYLGE